MEYSSQFPFSISANSLEVPQQIHSKVLSCMDLSLGFCSPRNGQFGKFQTVSINTTETNNSSILRVMSYCHRARREFASQESLIRVQSKQKTAMNEDFPLQESTGRLHFAIEWQASEAGSVSSKSEVFPQNQT